MNERTQTLHRLEDLQAVIDEAEPLLMSCIDWRRSKQAIASRQEVLAPYLDSLMIQFVDTLCHLANVGLDEGMHDEADGLYAVLKDRFDDQFGDAWRIEKERADEARHERVAA